MECGSRERHRLVALYLGSASAERFAGARVLHFSPEYFLAPYFSGADRYLTADMSAPGADIRTDITRMGIGDAAFDVVMCNHVLEHVDDDRAAIAEIHRVLAPGGLALITVPLDAALERTFEDARVTDPRERERRFGQFDHLRRYGKDFASRLAAPGFAVGEFRATPMQRARHAIHDATVIFLARKPG